MKTALVLNNICSGVFTEPDGSTPDYLNDPRYEVVPDEVVVGWIKTGDVWGAPPPPVALTWDTPDLPAEYWWIYTGPFKDRFAYDWAAISASDHPICRAAIGLTTDRQYIDLKGSINTLLDAMIATGQPEANPYFAGAGPVTPEKKAAIVSVPSYEHERYIKGLPQPEST